MSFGKNIKSENEVNEYATQLSEFQLHEGWIEIMKAEKRTMKE